MITDRVIRISRWRGPSGKKNGQGNFSLFLQVSNPSVLGPPSFCVLSFTDFLIVLLVPKKSSATPYQIINVQQYHMLTTWSICHQGQNIIHQAFLMSTKFQNLNPPPICIYIYIKYFTLLFLKISNCVHIANDEAKLQLKNMNFLKLPSNALFSCLQFISDHVYSNIYNVPLHC